MKQLPTLLVGVTLAGAGILRIWLSDSSEWTGALLAGAGLVLIGLWAAQELMRDKGGEP